MPNDAGLMSLALYNEGIPWMHAGARAENEHMGVIPQLAERHTLRANTGTTWVRPVLNKLHAYPIIPDRRQNNPQRLKIIRVLKIVPRGVTVQTLIPDELQRHLSRVVFMQFGGKAEAAMIRYQDQEGLRALNALPNKFGTGAQLLDPLAIRSIASEMRANADDPFKGEIWCVAHRYQVHTIESFLTNNWSGKIGTCNIIEDQHIDTDGDSALASIFGRASLLLVNDSIRRSATRREEDLGEGATTMFFRSKYNYGLENPAEWGGQINSYAGKPNTNVPAAATRN